MLSRLLLRFCIRAKLRRAFAVGLLGVLGILPNSSAFGEVSLTPIPPYVSGSYGQIVFDTLIGNRYYNVWMIACPGLVQEYAVMLTRKWAEGVSMNKLPFEVQLVFPDKMIYSTKPDGSATYIDAPNKIHITRVSADISEADAKRFISSWFSGLSEVRYGEPHAIDTPSTLATDGTSYYFHASDQYDHDERYGQTYAPSDGVALVMKESGECLVRYVKAPLKERENIMQDCRKLNDKLMELTK